MSMVNIYIIRHGESLATLDPSLFGRTDPATVPLTQWGYEQSVEAGQYVKEHAAGRKLRVYYSPHLRIVQSKDGFLKGLQESCPTEIQEEPLLKEREHGDFHGLDTEAQKAKNPDVFAKLHSIHLLDRYRTKMPNGESIEDVQMRMLEFIDKMKREVQPDEDVVIITHGGNCRALADNLTHDAASWITQFNPPPTGDIMLVQTDFKEPGTLRHVHHGKERPPALPGNYKTAPHAIGVVMQ